jgi:ferric-dicitrate binding protein FerR (iron transport regulator)
MSPDNDRADPSRPGVLRRIGRAALSPWRSLRIGERMATLRREVDELRSRHRRAASWVRLDETGFDLEAMAFPHGQGRRTFEETLASRRRSTARNAWIFLGLGLMFFGAWLYRLVTMTWTVNATLTGLQFTPACAVFFRFALENYQIRQRRKVSVLEFLATPNGFWPC